MESPNDRMRSASTSSASQLPPRPSPRSNSSGAVPIEDSKKYIQPMQGRHGEAVSTVHSQAQDSSASGFERVLNTEEAAALLQIHPKTLQRMARQGVVPAFRIGDLWRFRASALDEWLRSGLSSKSHSCR